MRTRSMRLLAFATLLSTGLASDVIAAPFLAATGVYTEDFGFTGTTPDTYANTTSAFSATIDGNFVVLPNATDELIVQDLTAVSLVLTQDFTDDPVAPGETVTVEFTIDHDQLEAYLAVCAEAHETDMPETLLAKCPREWLTQAFVLLSLKVRALRDELRMATEPDTEPAPDSVPPDDDVLS